MGGLGDRHLMARHHILDYSVGHSAGLGGGSVPHPSLQLDHSAGLGGGSVPHPFLHVLDYSVDIQRAWEVGVARIPLCSWGSPGSGCLGWGWQIC